MATLAPGTLRSRVTLGVLAMSLGLLAAAGGSPESASVSASAEDAAEATPEVERLAAAFLEAPSTDSADVLIAAMAADGNQRWVPWLVDLLRMNVSNMVSVQIGDGLESITGLPSTFRVPDMNAYGQWAQTRGLDGGDGYVAFKATLYERIDPAFGRLLRSIVNPATVAAIQWGGVPLGGIPELNDPPRIAADDADWMQPDEVVLGVVVDGEAVAYPLRLLARHELVNDTVGGDNLAIVYCTLCRSALVFERDVAGHTLDFLTSGLLLNSNKIMYDVQTGTLWHHLRGLAIGGELVGTELVVRPLNHLRWSDWVAENPTTDVLELPAPIYGGNPERPALVNDYTPGETYRSYYESPDVWFPVLGAPATFALKTEVVGINRNDDSVAFDVLEFNARGESVEIVVGGDTLTVVPTGAGARVFDANGARVVSEQSFWFAWYANHPDTRALTF